MKILLSLFLLFSSALSGYVYELSVCAIFNDDARFLEEWIDYHKHVGVEHFYLFNNRSQDNYQQVLQPYMDQGEVTLIDWPFDFTNGQDWNWVQTQAYVAAINFSKGVSRWLAIIDTDEFIVPVQKQTIPEVLKKFVAAPAVGVNWMMYGSSDVYEVLPGERMTYRLLMRAEDNWSEHKHIKSIVQPEWTIDCQNPHCCKYIWGDCINTDWQKVDGPLSPYVCANQLRINHYWTRDKKFMYEQKIPRRYKMYKDTGEWIVASDQMHNVVYDDIMLRKW